MFPTIALLAFAIQAARAQQVGNYTAETHPSLTWSSCTSSGCTSQSGSITLDANWRWLHALNSTTNCYTGNTWNATLCPDDATCAKNCALDGAAYSSTYGITTSGNALTLNFITTASQKNIGSRVYLMANDTTYESFKMLNQEIAFDVDMSKLPCGLNGAVYFSEMAADGGLSSTNTAGAKYGTGYCDSQCPRDIKFIGGAANSDGWTASPNDTNAGTGRYGACCSEMDLWEANVNAAAYTPHPCNTTGLTKCDSTSTSGTNCGGSADRYGSVCDPDGCDFNSFRQGAQSFLGPGSGFTIDTTQKITVVTQFLTTTNTSSGTLNEIRRLYVQNGKVIQNSASTQPSGYNSITSAYCSAQKTLFGDTNSFGNHGGLAQLGSALGRGVVLVLSVWDDHAVNMLWLDSDYPTTANAATPGIARGNCSTTSGAPTDVENSSTASSIAVTYSNIKVGPIGSTYSSNGTTTTTTTSSSSGTGTTTSTSSSATQTKYGQCAGTGYTGPTTCASGSTCTYNNPYYSQCL